MKPTSKIFKSYLYGVLMFSTVLFLDGCCKAVVSHEIYYKNDTRKTIRLEVYRNGGPNTLILNPSSFTNVEAPFIFGDSVLVYADNILKQVHYPGNASSFGSSEKAVKFSDQGSLFNLQGYATEKRETKCGGSLTKSTYLFID